MKKQNNKSRSCTESIPTSSISKPIVGKYEFEPSVGTYGEWIFKEVIS
jgi:hypothetical protein